MMPNPSLEPRGNGHWTFWLILVAVPLFVLVSVPAMKSRNSRMRSLCFHVILGGLIFQKGSLAAKKVNKAIGDVGMVQEFKEKSPKLD